ncbi:RNA-directed DNA polymerase, eukaryota, reverse transcriptase zinc-binding domain protein [Tanacetum coccineum]
MKADIIAFVQEFFSSSIMPKGCNTSFIALIPKISNPLVVSDYRPISLIGAQYKIIAKLLANRLARVIDSVISCEQTAFVKHRQILDDPLMVNEVIKWCNRKRDKLMIFKIDFEKAFDSISWDYVLQIMKFMGFHGSWISWIRGCLNHATSSVLVNESPTNEFHLSRGLRQGDPLSPFLFIIAMEGLHVAIEDAIAAGLYRVSGLKINFHKSNLVGVGVPFDEVKALAQLTGCQASPPYFKYLGLPVGFNMAATTNWDFLIDKFSKRLSNWKASMLSIGGRTTLLSSVLGSIGTYYCSIFPMPSSIYKKLESLRSKFFWGSNVDGNKIPWIAWNTALASKVHGGLGIGSLFSLNQALILKWRWRFFQNPNALWVRVIKAVHGGPGLDNSFYSHVRDQGVWGRIAKSINAMHEKGIIPLSFLRKRVGNGTDTKFWQDVWIGEISLQSKFPRLYRLALNKECSICEVWNNGWVFNWSRPILRGTLLHQLNDLTAILDSVQFSDSEDSWIWSLGSPSFTVKCTRDHIDNCILPDDGSETIWNRYLPKKINIFLWRAVRDRLPSRWNLSRRGIELDSLTCPTCDSSVETSIHSLWLCSLAADIWNKVFAWLDLEVPPSSCIRDLFVWIGNMHVTSLKKDILTVICGVTLWALWRFRNETIFGSSPPRRCFLFDFIVEISFRWYSTRNKLSSTNWNNWMQNPLMYSPL